MESVDPGMLDGIMCLLETLYRIQADIYKLEVQHCRNRNPNDSKSTAEPCSWWQHS